MEYTELQALQASATAALHAKLAELRALRELATATGLLVDDIYSLVGGGLVPGSHVTPIIVDHRDKLEPLANSLGFSLQPSPTYVGQFVIVPWSKA